MLFKYEHMVITKLHFVCGFVSFGVRSTYPIKHPKNSQKYENALPQVKVWTHCKSKSWNSAKNLTVSESLTFKHVKNSKFDIDFKHF